MTYDPKRALELLRIGSGRADATFREGQSGGAKGIVDEGAIEKQKKPVGYIVKQSSLFE